MNNKTNSIPALISKIPGLASFFGDQKTSVGKPATSKKADRPNASETDPLHGTELTSIGSNLDASSLPKAPTELGPAKIRPILKVHPTETSTKLMPIVLSTRRAAWRREDVANVAQATPEDVSKKVKKRDKGACRYCGFVDHAWNEIHILNSDRPGDDPSNLVTACHLCRLCWDIGQAGVSESGVLIWAPGILQRDLNDLVRANWVAEMDGEQQSDGAKALHLTLLEAQRGAFARLHTSSPLMLANALVSLPDEEYSRRGDKLDGIRLLNVGKHMIQGTNHLSEVVKSWVESGGTFAKRRSARWDRLLAKAETELSGASA